MQNFNNINLDVLGSNKNISNLIFNMSIIHFWKKFHSLKLPDNFEIKAIILKW